MDLKTQSATEQFTDEIGGKFLLFTVKHLQQSKVD